MEVTMKTKKLSLAVILLAVTMVAYIVATFVFCYTTKPKVPTGEFPFSITYEYQGEKGTLSGVLQCEFAGSWTIHGIHDRYWDQEIIYDNPDNLEYPFVIEDNSELQRTLTLYPNMIADYFMGDPLYADYYETYDDGTVRPYVSYNDHINHVFLEEARTEEELDSIGFKIIDYSYADSIENSFSFSGIHYEADNLIIFEAIMLLYFLLCLILVRRDKEYTYTKLDKVGIVFNFLVFFIALPFITLICLLFGLVESSLDIVNQIVYNIPPFLTLCLALSVVLRRKGKSKPGFFIQFVGVLPFAMFFVLEYIFGFH